MSNKTGNTRSGGPIVVLEMTNDWLKILQFEPSRRGRTLSKAHFRPAPAGDVGLAQCIAGALKDGKFAKVPVIGCLPRQAVTVRMLELPSTDLEEIADMVDLQVGKLTPYSKEEIIFDYMVFGAARNGYTKVLVAIVQRSTLRQRFYVLEEAGVAVERMTVSSEGLLNWFSLSKVARSGSGVVIVLDVDSLHTDCSIIADGTLVSTRCISIGGDHLQGGAAAAREKLAGEIKRAIVSCSDDLPGVRTGKVVVTGAGPRMRGLCDYIEGQLGLAVDALDSLSGLSVSPGGSLPDDPDYTPLSVTPLLGLGLRPEGLALDIVPDSVRHRTALFHKAKGLTVFAMLLMTSLVAASAYTTIRYQRRHMHFSRRAEAVRQTAAQVKAISRMRDIIKVVDSRSVDEACVLRQLAQVHAATPEDLYYDVVDVNVGERQVLLEGEGETPRSIRMLVKNLETSPLFANVQEGATTRSEKTRRYSFRVVCSLETGAGE
jgi:Tfp pilus assembly PilM family ATPase